MLNLALPEFLRFNEFLSFKVFLKSKDSQYLILPMFGDILIEEIWPMFVLSTILPCWIDRAYIRDWRACLYVNGLSLALLGQSNLVFFRFKSQYYFDLDWQLFHLIWLNIVNTVNDEFILLKPHCTAYVSPFIVQFRLVEATFSQLV